MPTLTNVQLLVTILEQAYDRKSWHGPNLRGSVRGLTAEDSDWRPGPGRHNIHEITLHAAYWKYIVRRRLTGEKRGAFPLKGSNWFPAPADWKATLALLAATHRSLVEEVAAFDPRHLTAIPRGSKVSNLAMITGAAAHDLYHAGQIQLLKRLRKG